MATGFHGFHVLIGTIFLIVCLVRAYKGDFTPQQHFGFEAAAWYWHFVDVVWLFLFVTDLRLGRLGRTGPRRLMAEAIEPTGAAPPPRRRSRCKGLCPRCGAQTLFAGWSRFADRCRACGLDFSAFNVGDGPAAFLTLILGAIVVGAGDHARTRRSHPPFWVHVLIWVPVTAGGVIVRRCAIAKGALLAARISQRRARRPDRRTAMKRAPDHPDDRSSRSRSRR